MLVQLTVVPRGFTLAELIERAQQRIGKQITVDSPAEPLLNIEDGQNGDLAQLSTLGIQVERIWEK